jgi:hypothetical protein
VTPLPTDQVAPTSPTSLSYSDLAPTQVKVKFTGSSTDSGGSGLAGYVLLRQRGTEVPIPVRNLPIIGAHEAWATSLQPNTTYTFYFVAIDKADNVSTPSVGLSITTPN